MIRLLALVLAFWGTLALGLLGFVLVPDAALYIESGWSLYPSPLGTFLGFVLGSSGFIVLHSLAVVSVAVLLVAASPSRLPVLLSLPVLWWLVPVGIQALGALVLVLGVLASRQRTARLLYALAPLLHAALLPSAALLLGGWLAVGVGAAVGGVLLTTPYGAAFPSSLWALGSATGIAATVLLLGLAPLLGRSVKPERARVVWLVSLGTFATVVYAAQADLVHRDASYGLALFAATRYALPLTICVLLLGCSCPDGQAERPPTVPRMDAI